ncbi:hypothetical protein TCAL_04743 [Tigriopus californicus]|uniref:hydroxymethylbilane synthase n=1 Tax=Tigriopus californicus TaxID=6832 RepID=A0A553P3V8_TIGCA|nr:porphobilinogen deaminase-like [Tigriopus californicus]XP_059087213.1 porphobilinogen deaminase-like [Tigriopus californicus]XP_059087214.1 porphobilinogen deaminase-like [Tigriopus californicus]TRY72376.1 hypothetical protein TCAL_04743 [Tigriopus californicus]|eukprot:TCALIF_04743-PA protein Name:"Similar to HMBS Porphobilinogen deaminase (Homo sapiens)" AED:0.06 eAED:0.06 QI:10/1/0.75/1/0.66/0.75/4/105/349
MADPPDHLVIGTRKSTLAMIQTHYVEAALKETFPTLNLTIDKRTTKGDEVQNVALNKIGDKSLFTKELELALEAEEVDIVVHSLKDLPTTLPPNMIIGAILKREDPKDAVIIKDKTKYAHLSELPEGSVIGTSSVRRAAQIRANFPHLTIKDIRGNLNTRVEKKLEGTQDYDAIILAFAGIARMGWEEKISHVLDDEHCLHAVGQGALAVECRVQDLAILKTIQTLTDRNTALACIAERAFMCKLEGGCSAPVAAHAQVQEGVLSMKGGVWSLDGSDALVAVSTVTLSGNSDPPTVQNESQYAGFVGLNLHEADLQSAHDLGLNLALKLIKRGAEKILMAAKLANATPS